MDAFIQHLATEKDQIRVLCRSKSGFVEWLRLELDHCLDYLHHVNKFQNVFDRRRDGVDNPSHATEEFVDLIVPGRKHDIRMKLVYISTEWDLEPVIQATRIALATLSRSQSSEFDIFVMFVLSRGKWANRAIGDCLERMEDSLEISFEKYSPYLLLTRHNEYQDPLEENIILRLYYSYL
jgi:hypothetical protein